MNKRSGISLGVIVIVVIVVVAVAGVGAYEFVFSVPSATGGKSTTTTLVIGTTTSSDQTSSAPGSQTYRGTFTYVTPLGPFGINDSSGKPVEWNSTQSVSGTFTFSINPATYIGTGSGQGTIIVATHGYCTGSTTVQYTFTIEAVHPPGQNFEISFNPPTPSTVTVELTCQGSTKGFNEANNPVTFLSVYPNGLNVASIPTTASQVPTGGISYTVTIT